MKLTDHQEFQYTPKGLQRARAFAKEIGKLDDLEAQFSTDGYRQVHQCNQWFNQQKSNEKKK